MNRSLFSVALWWITSASFAFAQTPDTGAQDQLLALVKEVRAQQTQLTDNQAKIDEKMAAIAEAVRQARIYASRGGR